MAQIRWSGIGITDGRGIIGGTQFSKGPTGNIASVQTVPKRQHTRKQQTGNTNYRTVTQHWKTLTEEQREAWDEAGADVYYKRTNSVGVDYQPSGQSLFIELNLNVFDYSWPIETPGAKPVWTEIGIENFSIATTPTMTVEFSTGTIEENEIVLVEGTGYLSQGQMSIKQPNYRVIERYDSGDFSSSLDIVTPFELVWGGLKGPSKVFLRCSLMDKTSGEKTLIGYISALYNPEL